MVLKDKIVQYIENIEYFKTHKQYIFKVPLKKDPYGRANVFALLRGDKNPSSETIILHGHMDTVGVDDFGNLSDYAFDSEILKKKLKELDLSEKFKILQFFPSLSDSSYIKIDDDYNSIQSLIDNFPDWSHLYNIPIHEINSLNIPAINYGCYGKDAHKWTERVYKPYSFDTLPKLILLTVYKFLNN
jgi:arginine utilization protein RocB